MKKPFVTGLFPFQPRSRLLLGGITLLFGLYQLPSYSAEPAIPLTHSKKGPHGGEMIRHKGRKFEIKLDQEAKKLDVFTPDSSTSSQPLPQNIGVTLYKNDKTGNTIRLKTVNQPEPGYLHYQGELSPNQASYVALGFQFDFAPSAEPSQQK